MTEAELRAAVLAALLEYDAHIKERRLKTLKKALRGTVMATVIGSTGLMAANQGRNQRVHEAANIVAPAAKTVSIKKSSTEHRLEHLKVPGVAHFGLNQHDLHLANKARLLKLTTQIPNDAEIFVIGRADALGGYAHNVKLAKNRALAVAKYLSDQGLNVKSITGKVSKQPGAGFLARRVDIVVRHKAAQSLAVNLPSLLDLYLDHLASAKSRAAPEKASVSQAANNIVAKTADKPTLLKHQKVSGVAHFSGQHIALTRAHKERLNELARQLPPSARLTVIGRTDPFAVGEQNRKISKQRAFAVASYLASQGLKVTGIGVKPSRKKYHDWMSQRVDVVVSHASPHALTVKLNPPVNRQTNAGQSQGLNISSKPDMVNGLKANYIAQKLIPSFKNQKVNNTEVVEIPVSDSATPWREGNRHVGWVK